MDDLDTDGTLSFLGTGAFSSPSVAGQGEVRYETRGTATPGLDDDYTHVFVDVDGSGQADVEVMLSGHHDLAAADFLLG